MKSATRLGWITWAWTLTLSVASAREIHVSTAGNDLHEGTAARPLRSIAAAAQAAHSGDTITVHAGVYRERVNPPRGGDSDQNRIVYQAAPDERVVITGSEIVTGWQKVEHDTWRVVLPNAFFGEFNPYRDLIHGDWFDGKGREHHTGAVYVKGDWLTEAAKPEAVLAPIGNTPLWFGRVTEKDTTIWAQFRNLDPNAAGVEINVRQCVFYPEKPGMNFITVRGFTLRNAATPWSPPTAEQIGLIGTHWSKGWIIENNDIQYSVCAGITLGKHGDEFDNTSQGTATGYVKTIERAIEHGWSKENIGHHLVRNNHIAHCEQAGIAGSLGAIFSTITGNHIHDIHVRQLFTGWEMAGIKIHAAIDTEISHNYIHHTVGGMWLDWMAQGTRVTGNVMHDNNTWQDVWFEVDHGPFMMDHNILLSTIALYDQSEGGAYVHNLFGGAIKRQAVADRETPYHPAHTTEMVGLADVKGGDNRFFNNIFAGHNGLALYDDAARPLRLSGNVFLAGAVPARAEKDPIVIKDFNPGLQVIEKPDGIYLRGKFDPAWSAQGARDLVTTALLDNAAVPNLPYVQPDTRPYRLNSDFFGRPSNEANPFPGPFEISESGEQTWKVWSAGQK